MQINPKVAHTEIGETVILLNSGADKTYHELNATGSIIWKGLLNKHSSSEIQKILMDEFDVSAEEAVEDVTLFIESLKQLNLIADEASTHL